jgi:excisionase family DNA binding protein
MENPFGIILERLDRIEKAIDKLNSGGSIAQLNDPMNIKKLAAYLKMSPSAIYKFTSTGTIPHYKNGKRLFFKREKINEWKFTTKINTGYDIEREATEYIQKNPRK